MLPNAEFVGSTLIWDLKTPHVAHEAPKIENKNTLKKKIEVKSETHNDFSEEELSEEQMRSSGVGSQ